MALEFLEFLSTIADPRRAQGRKWLLGPVLLATILAVLSGANSYRKVHGFIEAQSLLIGPWIELAFLSAHFFRTIHGFKTHILCI